MRRITLVALAVFVMAAAAASCIASDGAKLPGNAAAIASGIALDKDSVKKAVAATQAVGLPSAPAGKQIQIGPPPAAQKEVTAAGPSAAQMPPACPPAIDQAALKQMLLPALESALKEIRAEMAGAQKPSTQAVPAAPEVKGAPAPRPQVTAAPTPKPEVKAVSAPKGESGAQVWPAVPATGRAEPVAAVSAPSAGGAAAAKSVPEPAAAVNSTPSAPAGGQCASCDRERQAPLPEPVQVPAQVQPQATKPVPAAASTTGDANPSAAAQPPAPRVGQIVIHNRTLQQALDVMQSQGSYTPGGGVTNAGHPAGQAVWAPTSAAQGVSVPDVGTQPRAPR
ncbi:MAG: hypothetical protein LDL33_15120 [Desulfomonile sp.]|nr:hypothetical protein [Desulfomonile sp.]